MPTDFDPAADDRHDHRARRQHHEIDDRVARRRADRLRRLRSLERRPHRELSDTDVLGGVGASRVGDRDEALDMLARRRLDVAVARVAADHDGASDRRAVRKRHVPADVPRAVELDIAEIDRGAWFDVNVALDDLRVRRGDLDRRVAGVIPVRVNRPSPACDVSNALLICVETSVAGSP